MKIRSRNHITSHEEYMAFCLEIAGEKTAGYDSILEVEKNENRINVYPNIDQLGEPRDISVIDEILTDEDRLCAKKCILEGRLFSEHAAAGEATRLGLGTKYLINIPRDLTLSQIARMISEDTGKPVSPAEVRKKAGCTPEQLLPLSLGTRHMLQFAYDIHKLAEEFGLDPQVVLSRQKMLIVLNESTAETIIREMKENNLFGFSRANVLFMIQKAYPGIDMHEGTPVFDRKSPRRLHNHGQILLQQTMHDQIFVISENGGREIKKSYEYGDIIENMTDKVTYNIENLRYLTGSIDYDALAFSLRKGREGYRMVMEIVGNDPEAPQKGGMAAYDPVLGRNVMIEGFQLRGIKNHEIRYLNKNFNHYPNPLESWTALKENGINMPVTVKDGRLYFQPVQGDVNFLVETAFFSRKTLNPIRAWKSPLNTPLAMRYMHSQDCQPGFRAFARSIVKDFHCRSRALNCF